MGKHKIFKNIEVFAVESDAGAKLIVDVGKLRLQSGTFSSEEDAMQAADFIDFIIEECIQEGVFGDLRQGELF